MASNSHGPSGQEHDKVFLTYTAPDGKLAQHSKIILSQACTRLTNLTSDEYRLLKEDISDRLSKRRTLLKQKITIKKSGEILDGRHRARILVELGLGNILVEQIQLLVELHKKLRTTDTKTPPKLPQQKHGWFVEITTRPKLSDEQFVVQTQIGRRNATKWPLAAILLPDYQAIATDKRRLNHNVRNAKGQLYRNVTEFCEANAISDKLFQGVALIKRYPSIYKKLETNQLSYRQAIREAKQLQADEEMNPQGQSEPHRATYLPILNPSTYQLYLSVLRKSERSLIDRLVRELGQSIPANQVLAKPPRKPR